MNSSFNKEAIKDYSEQFAEIVMKSFFQNKAQITGTEILNLTEITQINLFILKLLFDAWQNEMDKLKSPYFEMENSDVQQALTKYKNTISRHILVNKTEFRPLLEDAVYKALLIILSPYHYYQEELKDFKGKKELPYLKNSKKFTKVNQSILDAIIANVEKESSSSNNSDELLDRVLEETDLIPDDSTTNIEHFNKVLPIDFNNIYLENESDEESVSNDTVNSSTEDVDDYLEDETDDNDINEVEETTVEVKEEIEEETEHIDENEVSTIDENNEEIEESIENQNEETEELIEDESFELDEKESKKTDIPSKEHAVSNELFKKEDEIDDVTDEEKPEDTDKNQEVIEEAKVEEDNDFNEESAQNDDELEEVVEDSTNDENVAPENNPLITLNDTFSKGDLETLADLHEKQGIDKIETSITLNQRFMFVNGLFDGDVDTFNSTIKNLDGMSNYDEAMNYIESQFSHWDKKDEDVIEFFDLIKKRYV